MKRFGVFVLICAVLTGALMAGGQNEVVSDDGASKTYKIGINSYAENFESSQRYLSSMRAAAEKAGNVELVYTDCNADPQRMTQNYDSLILQQVDAIIDISWFGEVGPMAVQKCKTAGIPLIVCDSPFDTEYSYTIGTDQYQAGLVAGEYLAQYVRITGMVPLITSSSNTSRMAENR